MAEYRDRVKPFDISAEAAVLSALLVDPVSVIKSIEIVREEYFYRNEHRIIFLAIRELFNKQSEVDPITLIDYLKKNGQLEKVGGEPYIFEITDIVVSGANFEYHVKILYDKYILRELILVSNKIVEKCYEEGIPPDELLDYAENEVYQLSETSQREGFSKVSSKMTAVLQTIEDMMSNRKGIHGLSTGFKSVDRVLGGLRPGQFIVVAARPGVGKSAFVTNIASNTALNDNSKVAFFTMEMATEEVITRMISTASEIPLDYLLKGYGMDQEKIMRVTRVVDVINKLDIYFDDTGTNTSLDIRAKARRLKAEIGGLDLVIIDYLQLMSSYKKNNENRQQEIAEISRSLKVLAKELSVPVIALSQLNRTPASRDDNKPRLSDLRESGAIEQDADVVIFIYRKEVKDRGKEKDEANVNEADDNKILVSIAKNRQGRTMDMEMNFYPKFTMFVDIETSDHGTQ
jgi:replicative DNA helicase